VVVAADRGGSASVLGESLGAVLQPRQRGLRAVDVAVEFGGVQALSGVGLDAPAGAVTGLIGPNGAGKTTLFDVLTGLERADRGRVELDGRDISRWPPRRRARAGLARTFQRLELFWSLSVADNVRVAAEASVPWWRTPGASRGSVDAAVRRALDRVGVAELAEVPAGRLSTGQARLVELARAVVAEPAVLLADEPGSGLDDTEVRVLATALRQLAADGMAVVLVEHDMALVMAVCTTITVLDGGRVLAVGPPDTVRRDPAVQAAYLGRGR
jgi:branched-chain amino acid transport system ATP-binding protein